MSDLFYADVVGENRVRNFDRQPEAVRRILFEKIRDYTERTRDLAADLLDQRLESKTGRLTGAAIQTEVEEVGKAIRGRVFIENIPYAKAQEEGAVVPPHMIYPRNAKILAFIGATGDKVFASRVFHPGGTIPPKYFMKDAYRQMGAEISRGLKQAIVQGIREDMRRGPA